MCGWIFFIYLYFIELVSVKIFIDKIIVVNKKKVICNIFNEIYKIYVRI